MNITTFKAFGNRNYRLYFSGQSISLIGTWMQRTAVYWLVYTRTHSAFMLGLAVFAAQFPSFLLSPLGGVISDRYNRHRVLLITQIASLVQASLLTLLVVFTNYSVAEILGFSVVLGTINAFDVPARQSLVVDLIAKKENLANAIALNSSMVNLARLIGPAISGIVLEKFGAGTCFLINAVSFLSVITSLLFMRLPQYVSRPHTKKVVSEFKEGWHYLAKTPSIGFVILMLAFVSLLVLPFSTLLPVYAKVIFKGSASTFGYLNSAIGLGAIGGAFFLASLKPGANLTKIIFINLVIFGAGLILFSHMTNLPIALFFAVIAGFGMMSQTTISNTIIQTSVSPAMRGRVISYFAMAYFGMQPLGGLLIGTVSEYFGAPNTILAEGTTGLLIAAIFYSISKRKNLRKKDEIKIIELEDPEINPLVNADLKTV
ncbi:MAG: MFS transporter [Bacteroidota bacterium]|nr:MFS transporter [Bacteroidota bacterium]